MLTASQMACMAKETLKQATIDKDSKDVKEWMKVNKGKVKHGPLVTVDFDLAQPKRAGLRAATN